MRIYLIGMPGCGKSTLGKRLAKKLNYEFIDMDSFIEKNACMFIDEIFDSYGEDYFRALEKNTLDDFLKLDNVIIATGGGVIKDLSNKEKMNGLCIYLKVPNDILTERTSKSKTIRPLLQTKTIDELYEERKEKYDYFKDIEVDNVNIEYALSKIMEEIKC